MLQDVVSNISCKVNSVNISRKVEWKHSKFAIVYPKNVASVICSRILGPSVLSVPSFWLFMLSRAQDIKGQGPLLVPAFIDDRGLFFVYALFARASCRCP